MVNLNKVTRLSSRLASGSALCHLVRLSILVLCLGVTRSHAQDYQWRNVLPYDLRSLCFNPLSQGRTMFTMTNIADGIYRSDDGGLTWQTLGKDMASGDVAVVRCIFCPDKDTNVVIVVSEKGLYRSKNGGVDWTLVLDQGGCDAENMAYNEPTGNFYYAEYYKGPFWRSTDLGATWTQIGASDTSVENLSLGASQDAKPILISGNDSDGGGALFRSSDEGATWSISYPADDVTFKHPEVSKVVFSRYATGSAVVIRWNSPDRPMMMTTNYGASWTNIPATRHAWALDFDQRASRVVNSIPTHFFVGYFNDRADTLTHGLVQETTDGGASWLNTNFPKDSLVHDVWVLKYDSSSDKIAAATGSGLFITGLPSSVHETDPGQPTPRLVATYSPGTRMLSATWTLSGATSLGILDVLGRTVLRRELHGEQEVRIDAQLAPGFYIATLQTQREVATRNVTVAW